MGFKKGNPGRPKGAIGKLTKTVKETVLNAFNTLQEDPEHNIIEFAKKNPKDFYLIASKLIPTEVNAKVEDVGVKTYTIVNASESGNKD